MIIMIRELKSEKIKGIKCNFKKYPNGFVEGRCPREGVVVGSHKTKAATIKSLRKMLPR